VRRVSNREAGQHWTQVIVMKLGKLEFVRYTMQNFLHLIFQNDCSRVEC
jgi:hypothetical protein